MSVFSQISSAEEDRETEGRGGQGMGGGGEGEGEGEEGGLNKRRLALNLIRIEPAESCTLREMNCEE